MTEGWRGRVRWEELTDRRVGGGEEGGMGS